MDPFLFAALAVVAAFDILILAGLWFLAAYSKANRPGEVNRGQISEITGKPNCVSSLSEDASRKVDPIAYSGDDEEAWETLVSVIRDIPKSKIVTNDPPYLYAEMQTRLFGFVDDLEVQQNTAAKVFHLRSASRVGYSDLGANRKRVNELRRRFAN